MTYLHGMRIGRMLVAAWLLILASPSVNAHDAKSTGQTVYLPIYSTIAHWSPRTMDLTITLSVRNVDPKLPVTLNSVDYFDTDGRKKKSMLAEPKLLPPYGSTQFIIKRDEFRGDVGANAIVSWQSNSPTMPPLVEAIMIGSDGSQAYSFASRGIVIEQRH